MHEFVIYVRKYNNLVWLPIACPNRESVDSMIAHVLGRSGEYDVVRVAQRVPDTDTFVLWGERHTRPILADPPIGA